MLATNSVHPQPEFVARSIFFRDIIMVCCWGEYVVFQEYAFLSQTTKKLISQLSLMTLLFHHDNIQYHINSSSARCHETSIRPCTFEQLTDWLITMPPKNMDAGVVE